MTQVPSRPATATAAAAETKTTAPAAAASRQRSPERAFGRRRERFENRRLPKLLSIIVQVNVKKVSVAGALAAHLYVSAGIPVGGYSLAFRFGPAARLFHLCVFCCCRPAGTMTVYSQYVW